MSTRLDQLVENFFKWAANGCGLRVYSRPVLPEPPLVPFPGHRLPLPASADDGRRPNFFSRLTGGFKATLHPPPAKPHPQAVTEREPQWNEEAAEHVEFRLLLPPDYMVKPEAMTLLLASLSALQYPVTLELAASSGQCVLQFVTHPADARAAAKQLAACFPGVLVQPTQGHLADVWGDPRDGDERAVVEFALTLPYMMPLATSAKADLFIGLTGAMSGTGSEEAAVYQFTFMPAQDDWAQEGLASVMRHDGKPAFDDGADLLAGAKAKVSRPLFAALLRLAARSPDFDRVWELLRLMAAPLRLAAAPHGNRLMPAANDAYPQMEHCMDLVQRRSRRCGMILNEDELTNFIRLPGPSVSTPALLRLDKTSREAAPSRACNGAVLLGRNEHAGQRRDVWLEPEQRVRHLHLIGASGSGKTTLLFNLIRQDAESGAGFSLLDPHGDLVDKVLGIIPQERMNDVVLLDPSDEEFVIPFNFLSAHSDFEKTLLASDLVAIFRAQSSSWGDQMNMVFGNAIRAFLESPRGGTLADVRRFLLDPGWRDEFLTSVIDPELVFYWRKGFPQLGGNKSIGPILTRLETFLSPKAIRYMVSQRENRLDFADMMDRGKIFLARLPQGQMGRENAHLLGSLIVAKLQQMAMSRQRMDAANRRPFFVYADEFQNFICPSMAEILSGARKYRLGLILAHQDLRQLERDRDVAAAVLANAFTRVVFRVGDSDARALAEGFSHFSPADLQSLKIGQAICRIERADNDFNLAVPLLEEPDAEVMANTRLIHTRASRQSYGRPRAEVEAELSSASLEPTPKRGKEPPPSDAGTPSKEHPFVPGQVTPTTPPPVSETDSIEHSEPPARQTGKGGPLHITLQKLIKAAAEAKGFRAVMESPTGTGKESVDVALFREDLRIACEISVSTTIEHELDNARKCLRDDFQTVALILADERRAAQLSKAIPEAFSSAEQARLRCFTAEEFISYVTSLPEAPPAKPGEKTIRGWKVKRTHVKLTDEERAAKAKAAFDLLAQDMKLPPGV
jgi:hypothetical protein